MANQLKRVKLGNKFLEVPIIQGGMGVGISLGNLAGNVAKNQAMGTISAAQIGFKEKDFINNPLKANLRILKKEIVKAKKIANGKGLLACNVMVALNGYEEYVKEAVANKIDAIICGAGLALDLPSLVNQETLIAPIVSSKKALELLIRRWQKKFNREPDFVVIEGFEAGGHLGFKKKEVLANSYQSLKEILADCLAFLKEKQLTIPLFVAGGIYDHDDICDYLALNAAGVQMGTRFVATNECDAPLSFKEKYLKANNEDIVITRSPTGLVARAIKSDYLNKLDQNEFNKVNHCYDCLKTCNPASTVYCISEALIASASGKDGLFFSGSNACRIKEIIPVKQLMNELRGINR